MNYVMKTFKNKRYIQVPRLLELGVKHCFTTIDMNMMISDDDEKLLATGNFDEVFEFLNVKPINIYSGIQTHSKNIQIIDNYNVGCEKYYGRFFENIDGLMTSLSYAALVVKFADCTPILLYDPVKNVQSLVHSGWKGTLQRIVQHAIELMCNRYSSDVKDIIVAIGPAISKLDFEVRSDVEQRFRDEFKNWDDLITIKNDEKFLIDIVEINKRMLLEVGIQPSNIEIIPLSTYSTDYLHSYRRDGEKYGLMGLISVI